MSLKALSVGSFINWVGMWLLSKEDRDALVAVRRFRHEMEQDESVKRLLSFEHRGQRS